jgi:hypothetical protein
MRNLISILALTALAAACTDDMPASNTPMSDAGQDAPADEADDGSCTSDIDCTTGLCLEGMCREAVCRPHERSCASDQSAVQCNADGQDFTVIDTCLPGFRCHRGDCREFVCEPRTIECEGAAQRICNETGTRAELRPCGGERICVRGQCLEPQCEDGEVTCLDARTRRICEDEAYRLETCPGEEICDNGRCEAFYDVSFSYATMTLPRPVQGALALWLVPSGGLPGPELIVWGPLIVETTSEDITISFAGSTVITDRAFDPGVATHLVFTWSVGRMGYWRDGEEIANESIRAVEGGDVLELSTGDWRLGSLAIGPAPTASFEPACDLHGFRATEVWNMDEGQGGLAHGSAGNNLVLQDVGWHAGTLPVYGIDKDDDGWGWIHETAPGCAPRTAQYVLPVGDCNDEDAGIRPTAPEVPDGLDNDCDDEVDE